MRTVASPIRLRTGAISSSKASPSPSVDEHRPLRLGQPFASRGRQPARATALDPVVVMARARLAASFGRLPGKPALAVAGPVASRHVRVRHVCVGRRLFDTRAVPPRHFVHAVAAPARSVLMLAPADRDHDARLGPGPDDRVLRLRRAVHEVPLPQRALLALDDQERLARRRRGSPPGRPPSGTCRHRDARLEDLDVDPELREVVIAFEIARSTLRPSAWSQRASRAFSTNQPSSFGTVPSSVCSSGASGTTIEEGSDELRSRERSPDGLRRKEARWAR